MYEAVTFDKAAASIVTHKAATYYQITDELLNAAVDQKKPLTRGSIQVHTTSYVLRWENVQNSR